MDLEKSLKDLIISDDPDLIKKTADELKGLKYNPILLTDFDDFLSVDSSRFFPELGKILNSPEVSDEYLPQGETRESFREKKARILLYHYKLLNRLRRGEPEAWDEINELMEDD
ncbi:hypothetical protein [Oceanispirochaeta sp.]|jgi:hypothetical protein|uniref:hypothetical protein n=1 Tax=Oceanispirochaeta sp. TaxID=2035350 RepID=UPI002638B5E3|nr:hypothetical protein [Oceanispirochaeta sp.]MDA3957819.1 hypothetical protein [Oceanispirochaeta sp.]